MYWEVGNLGVGGRGPDSAITIGFIMSKAVAYVFDGRLHIPQAMKSI